MINKYPYVLKLREEIYNHSGVEDEAWLVSIGSEIEPVKLGYYEEEKEGKYGVRSFREVSLYLIKQQGQLYIVEQENRGHCQSYCEGEELIYIHPLHSGVGERLENKIIDYTEEKIEE